VRVEIGERDVVGDPRVAEPEVGCVFANPVIPFDDVLSTSPARAVAVIGLDSEASWNTVWESTGSLVPT
jgi:hypothetical protein